jgi:hypothetical protein
MLETGRIPVLWLTPCSYHPRKWEIIRDAADWVVLLCVKANGKEISLRSLPPAFY